MFLLSFFSSRLIVPHSCSNHRWCILHFGRRGSLCQYHYAQAGHICSIPRTSECPSRWSLPNQRFLPRRLDTRHCACVYGRFEDSLCNCHYWYRACFLHQLRKQVEKLEKGSDCQWYRLTQLDAPRQSFSLLKVHVDRCEKGWRMLSETTWLRLKTVLNDEGYGSRIDIPSSILIEQSYEF
jgi:hypothetical protein